MSNELYKLRRLYQDADALYQTLLIARRELNTLAPQSEFYRLCIVLAKARKRKERRQAAFARAYDADAQAKAQARRNMPCPLIMAAIAECGPAILTEGYRNNA